MKRGLISEMAKAASRFDIACCFLDMGRIVEKNSDQPAKMQVAIYTEFERLALEMHELRAYTPAWLVGWERRIRDTTRSGHN
jgi:hypothetical protein